MAREFKESAHLKTDKKKFADNFDSIDWSQARKWNEEDEAKKAAGEKKSIAKHKTAGLCGEFGMSVFDEKAYKENYERIEWSKKEEELNETKQELPDASQTSEISTIN